MHKTSTAVYHRRIQ